MTEEKVDLLLKGVKFLPPLPAAVEKILQLANDPEADMHDIARVISNDPALTARILRVVNSSFFGLSHQVSTVFQAITILGFQGVRNLALSVSVFNHFKQLSQQLSLEDIWKHSLAVASASRLIADKLKLADPEEMFVAGLMHDIGRLVLIKYFGEEYNALLKRNGSPGKNLYLLERDAFGIDHAKLGQKLCQHWNIPDKLGNVVASHHSPVKKLNTDNEEQILFILLKTANNIAKIAQLGCSGDSHVEVDFFRVVEDGVMSRELLRQIVLTLSDEVKQVEVFLDSVGGDKEETQQENGELPALALIVRNGWEREIIAMSLIRMGYTLRTLEQPDKSELKAVIADNSLSDSLREELIASNVLVLDYEKWQAENCAANSTLFFLPNLTNWLSNNLSIFIQSGQND